MTGAATGHEILNFVELCFVFCSGRGEYFEIMLRITDFSGDQELSLNFLHVC